MDMQTGDTNAFLPCAVSPNPLSRKHSPLYINLRNNALLNTTDSQSQNINRLWEYLNLCFLLFSGMFNGQSERACTSEEKDVVPALEWISIDHISVLRLQ